MLSRALASTRWEACCCGVQQQAGLPGAAIHTCGPSRLLTLPCLRRLDVAQAGGQPSVVKESKLKGDVDLSSLETKQARAAWRRCPQLPPSPLGLALTRAPCARRCL